MLAIGFVYKPDHYAKIADVYRQHLANLREKRKEAAATAEQSASSPGHQPYSWADFTPRMIPISSLLEGPAEQAPWARYLATNVKDSSQKDMSDSMVLLLEMCSNVVDTSVANLLQMLRGVEQYIMKRHRKVLALKVAAGGT